MSDLFVIQNGTTYFGALVGRVANRIGNARFTLNGVVYHLSANDGNNTLHGTYYSSKVEFLFIFIRYSDNEMRDKMPGGKKGFSKMVWTVEDYQANSHITFTYNSPDGEDGIYSCRFLIVSISLLI